MTSSFAKLFLVIFIRIFRGNGDVPFLERGDSTGLVKIVQRHKRVIRDTGCLTEKPDLTCAEVRDGDGGEIRQRQPGY